jgi:type I restriction enzyme S subunit
VSIARIGDISEFVLDGTHGSPVRTETGVPVLSAQNVNNGVLTFETERYTSDEEYQAFNTRVSLRKGDLLLTIVGTIGRAAVLSEVRPLVFQRSVAIIRPKIGVVDSRFLFHATQAQGFQAQLASSVNQSSQAGVYLGKLKELKVPIPLLVEQRRIADTLDRAEALRAKRRAAYAEIDSLARSIFIELFGDPATNPKGWTQVPFGELLLKIDSGWSPPCLDRPVTGDEWGVLKLGAVTWCEYDPSENKALPPDVAPDPELEVKPGDILFTRKNTYDLVAACALVRATPPRLQMSDLIFRFRLSLEAGIDSCFLHQLLIYPTKRREIQRLAGGSAGSMPNISKERLQSALIEVPPLALQREFGRRVAAVEKLKTAQRAWMDEMNALFAALQDYAFRGDICSHARRIHSGVARDMA